MMFLMNEIIKYWQKIPLYIANTVKIKNFIYLIGVISVVAGTYYKCRNYNLAHYTTPCITTSK